MSLLPRLCLLLALSGATLGCQVAPETSGPDGVTPNAVAGDAIEVTALDAPAPAPVASAPAGLPSAPEQEALPAPEAAVAAPAPVPGAEEAGTEADGTETPGPEAAASDAEALRVPADCARGIPRPPAFVPLGSGVVP